MRYLSVVRHAENPEIKPPPALMEAMDKLMAKLTQEGSLVDTGGLAPSRDGFRLRLAKGKLTTTDGPFIESKELIGGWAILSAESRAEAVRIAAEFMEVHRKHWPEVEFECEVRPIQFQLSDTKGADRCA